MRRDKNIVFTGGTDADRSVRRRILLIVVAVFLVGALSFVFLLARYDFDFKLFLGTRSPDELQEESQAGGDVSFSTAAAPFSDDNAVNLLFFCADGDKEDFCLLASFSEKENAIRVKPLSAESDYSWNGKNYTLRALFAEASAPAVAAAMQDKGIRVARYAVVSETSFKQLMQVLGDVDVTVPRDVSYAVDGITYSQKAGVQTMRGDVLLKYMKYAFDGDERYRAQGEAFSAVLRTHFTEENLLRGEDFFTSLLNFADTNISVFDYVQQKDAVQKFLQNEPRIEVIS